MRQEQIAVPIKGPPNHSQELGVTPVCSQPFNVVG